MTFSVLCLQVTLCKKEDNLLLHFLIFMIFFFLPCLWLHSPRSGCHRIRDCIGYYRSNVHLPLLVEVSIHLRSHSMRIIHLSWLPFQDSKSDKTSRSQERLTCLPSCDDLFCSVLLDIDLCLTVYSFCVLLLLPNDTHFVLLGHWSVKSGRENNKRSKPCQLQVLRHLVTWISNNQVLIVMPSMTVIVGLKSTKLPIFMR